MFRNKKEGQYRSKAKGGIKLMPWEAKHQHKITKLVGNPRATNERTKDTTKKSFNCSILSTQQNIDLNSPVKVVSNELDLILKKLSQRHSYNFPISETLLDDLVERPKSFKVESNYNEKDQRIFPLANPFETAAGQFAYKQLDNILMV